MEKLGERCLDGKKRALDSCWIVLDDLLDINRIRAFY